MPADIKAQTRESINNIKAILAEAGATLDNVVKTTVFLADMEYFRLPHERSLLRRIQGCLSGALCFRSQGTSKESACRD